MSIAVKVVVFILMARVGRRGEREREGRAYVTDSTLQRSVAGAHFVHLRRV